jgi:simple sugar transport system ATP-binding protein
MGIAGVAGNGQKELTEAIVGLRKKTGGSIFLCGEDITRESAYNIENKGVAFVPEDRHGMGLVPGLNAVDNVMLRDYDTPQSSRRGIVSTGKVAQRTKELIEKYDIKCAGLQRPVRLMSGGNMQKLLLAREISGSPKLLITCYPVRGLDIGATNAVHQILEDQRKNGVAVLLIAEDLEELFLLSDRISVLYKGRITGVVDRKDFSYETIGRLMVGSQNEEEVQPHA